MSENLKVWDALKTPPPEAMKKIVGGRLGGMTDIKPQWRYKAMTEQFGPIGFGWNYTIEKEWLEIGSDGNVCAFVNISLTYKIDKEWSLPVPGSGGSTFIAKESKGLHTSDECFKMATTDALSVAMKMIGVGADVYEGNVTHESKYSRPDNQQSAPPQQKQPPKQTATSDNANKLRDELLAWSLGNVPDAMAKLKELTLFQNDKKEDTWVHYHKIDTYSDKWILGALAKVKKLQAK